MIRVQVVGDVLIRGTGIGRNSAIGKVCIANDTESLEKNLRRAASSSSVRLRRNG